MHACIYVCAYVRMFAVCTTYSTTIFGGALLTSNWRNDLTASEFDGLMPVALAALTRSHRIAVIAVIAVGRAYLPFPSSAVLHLGPEPCPRPRETHTHTHKHTLHFSSPGNTLNGRLFDKHDQVIQLHMFCDCKFARRSNCNAGNKPGFGRCLSIRPGMGQPKLISQ